MPLVHHTHLNQQNATHEDPDHEGYTSMNKSVAVVLGGAIGALAAIAYTYLLGPAEQTRYDSSYQSRLDFALAEGQRAATEKELELTTQYRLARSRPVLSSLEDTQKEA